MIKLIQSFGTLALLAVPSISTETSIDVRLALGPGVYLRPWVAGEKEIIQGSSLKELHPDVDWLSSTPGAYLEYRLYYANSPYAPKEGSVDTRDFESRFDYVEVGLSFLPSLGREAG